jgi:hypothetical protein
VAQAALIRVAQLRRYALILVNIHDSIDEFVKVVDSAATIFRRIDGAPWIEPLEKLLPKRFPVSYGSLIRRYAFPAFDAGRIHFFANCGDQSLDELSVAIFQDPNIAQVTHANGFIQFARPEDGSYDPICFDVRRSANNREYPIVRLDHEDILSGNKIGSVTNIAGSFYRFVSDFVRRA